MKHILNIELVIQIALIHNLAAVTLYALIGGRDNSRRHTVQITLRRLT